MWGLGIIFSGRATVQCIDSACRDTSQLFVEPVVKSYVQEEIEFRHLHKQVPMPLKSGTLTSFCKSLYWEMIVLIHEAHSLKSDQRKFYQSSK